MGLDNGIVLATKREIGREEIPSYVTVERNAYNKKSIEYDVCYWRKCWNIRAEIFKIAGVDNGSSDLSIKQLEEIRDNICKMLFDGEKWEYEGMSIWSFDEMISHIAQDIVNISWLIDYLKKDHMAYAYFYDSY